MMECKYSEKTLKPGDVRFCVIIADTVQGTFPTNGENISGLPDTAVIDTGSVIVCGNPAFSRYMLFPGGQWVKMA